MRSFLFLAIKLVLPCSIFVSLKQKISFVLQYFSKLLATKTFIQEAEDEIKLKLKTISEQEKRIFEKEKLLNQKEDTLMIKSESLSAEKERLESLRLKEKELILQRRLNGNNLGGRPKISPLKESLVMRLRNEGCSYRSIRTQTGIALSTIRRIILDGEAS